MKKTEICNKILQYGNLNIFVQGKGLWIDEYTRNVTADMITYKIMRDDTLFFKGNEIKLEDFAEADYDTMDSPHGTKYLLITFYDKDGNRKVL